MQPIFKVTTHKKNILCFYPLLLNLLFDFALRPSDFAESGHFIPLFACDTLLAATLTHSPAQQFTLTTPNVLRV